MQQLDGRLVLSPTGLTHHQECAHLTRLDLGVAVGEWAAPGAVTPEDVQASGIGPADSRRCGRTTVGRRNRWSST